MQSYGSKPEDVAVLCRTNKLCAEVATFLAANGLQVNMHEGLPLNTQPVATLIAWMQLATKADNPLMFERMVRYPETLLDQGKIREVEQRVQARNERGNDRIGPVGYIVDMDARGKISAGTGAKRFVELVAEVRDMLSEENRLSSPFARVGEHVGVKAAAAASENAQDHAYTRFVMLADEMVEQIGLAKTLASLTSLDFNAGRTGVNVATMHSAKGLEFDIVFAPGWEEGEFPSRQRENEGSIDEERRLAYVTITRPKKMLVVSYAQSRKGQARPSRFIAEMDVNYDGEVQFDTAA
jgi:DNA helicase-2/ATP-dependent DNA helicase PcrA